MCAILVYGLENQSIVVPFLARKDIFMSTATFTSCLCPIRLSSKREPDFFFLVV